MEISIRHDFKKLQKDLSRIEKRVIPKAAKRALNKTAQQVKTHAAREISKKTGIKVGVVKKHLLKINAQFNSLTAAVIAKKYAPNLIEFMTAAQINRAMQRKGKGVRSRAWRKTKEYRGTFVGRGKGSGKLLVFSRTGPSRRSPIEAKPGPSIPRTFIQTEVMRSMKLKIARQFPKNFSADLKYFISKI